MDLTRTQSPNPFDFLPPRPEFGVHSMAFGNGEELPVAQRFNAKEVGGENVSPDLSWSSFPSETKGFALTCFDPDAPTVSGFWHWIVMDLDVHTTSLEAGAGSVSEDRLPGEAFHVRNDAGTFGYMGAAPPKGDCFSHRYIFTVYALDTNDLGVTPDFSATRASSMLSRHTLARAFLTGHFGH